MGIKSLAAGRTKLVILAAAPKDMAAPTIAELTAGIDASCRIAANDYTLGPAASETVSDPELCSEIATQDFGASNFEGSFAVFRYWTEAGAADATDEIGDQVYQALKEKGTEVWLAERFTAKKSKEAFATGDEIRVYKAVTDNPVHGPRAEGYIKEMITFSITDAEIHAVVAATA